MNRPQRTSAGLLAALLLAGCATPPPASVPAEPARVTLPSREQTLERDYRARAAALAQQGRWAEARVQWELLLLLRPGTAEYQAQLDATRRRIGGIAAEALAAAAAARSRGDLDSATTQYLRALAVDHDNAAAAQALRDIERDRTRRAYLNRPPRSVIGVLTGKPGAPVELESDYVGRQKPANGEDSNKTPRR